MKSLFQENIPRKSSIKIFYLNYLQLLQSLFFFTIASFSIQTCMGATTNERFKQNIIDICLGNITAPPGVTWNATALGNMCAVTGNGSGGGVAISANLGNSDTSNVSISPANKKVHKCFDDLKQDASNNDCPNGGWGLLFATQFGRSSRPETELENGFQSDLKGILVGIDYRFSDSFILGSAVGATQDEAVFSNSAGSLKTRNNTISLYTTWLPSSKFSIDGYVGYGAANYNSKRLIIYGTSFTGTTFGNTSSKQTLAGLSAAFLGKFRDTNISPFINIDYLNTDTKGFNETGSTSLELRYRDRTSQSNTASLGIKLSQIYTFKWGKLTPNLNWSGVHEFQSNSTKINNELVITPGAGILVATDEPDRDYFLSGFGVVATLNGGMLLFMNYERRSGDNLLDSWVTSLGLIKEF